MSRGKSKKEKAAPLPVAAAAAGRAAVYVPVTSECGIGVIGAYSSPEAARRAVSDYPLCRVATFEFGVDFAPGAGGGSPDCWVLRYASNGMPAAVRVTEESARAAAQALADFDVIEDAAEQIDVFRFVVDAPPSERVRNILGTSDTMRATIGEGGASGTSAHFDTAGGDLIEDCTDC